MVPLAFLQNVGLPELIIILVIALLIFGHKLPSVARSLGSSVNEFKKGAKEGELEAQKQEQAMSQIKCAYCGTTYLPATVGAPCPGCGGKPGTPPAAAPEKK
ncbi:MAG: twin-arginine translocase TatA/TatE family subunit [Planctomycetota bacterium]|nr:twin-arginine translocase TatA/TatE family subunit [Planctomycetota bacterium]